MGCEQRERGERELRGLNESRRQRCDPPSSCFRTRSSVAAAFYSSEDNRDANNPKSPTIENRLNLVMGWLNDAAVLADADPTGRPHEVQVLARANEMLHQVAGARKLRGADAAIESNTTGDGSR